MEKNYNYLKYKQLFFKCVFLLIFNIDSLVLYSTLQKNNNFDNFLISVDLNKKKTIPTTYCNTRSHHRLFRATFKWYKKIFCVYGKNYLAAAKEKMSNKRKRQIYFLFRETNWVVNRDIKETISDYWNTLFCYLKLLILVS